MYIEGLMILYGPTSIILKVGYLSINSRICWGLFFDLGIKVQIEHFILLID